MGEGSNVFKDVGCGLPLILRRREKGAGGDEGRRATSQWPQHYLEAGCLSSA
jgi:hypothetical protein